VDVAFCAPVDGGHAVTAEDVEDLVENGPDRGRVEERELGVGDHLKRHAQPVHAAEEPWVLLPVQGVQPQRGQVVAVQIL
jgi:hypothetical protein